MRVEIEGKQANPDRSAPLMIVTLLQESPVQFVAKRGPVLTGDVAARFCLDMREASRVLRSLERDGILKSEIGGLGWSANERRWSIVA